MDNIWLYAVVMLLGVLAAGFSQILLKKSALRNYDKWYKQYLNVRVITAYGLLLLSTLASVYAYSRLPLSSGPIWTAAEYIFVVTLSYMMLDEKPNKRKLLGLSLLLVGIVVFSL